MVKADADTNCAEKGLLQETIRYDDHKLQKSELMSAEGNLRQFFVLGNFGFYVHIVSP